jgi:GntR family transcriptional regulator/MocR family aminotransferase
VGKPAARALSDGSHDATKGTAVNTAPTAPVGGSQQALDLAARVTVDPGDRAWMEDPGYHGALGALVAAGADVEPVPVDGEGLDVEVGRARAPHARVAYVSPSHQFPLGVTMSLGRRLKLLDWARGADAWVLEDDYDSEFRYVSRPLTALQGLDADGRVLYVGTFSKVMFPALRIGYVVAPRSLQPALAATRLFADMQRSPAEQQALADFLSEGHFERHVRRMRALYAERQQCLVAALRQECGGLLELGPADAGMHLVAWFPADASGPAVQREAAAAGLDTIPLSAFTREPPARDALVLGYAHVDCAAMPAACRQLAAAVRAASRG